MAGGLRVRVITGAGNRTLREAWRKRLYGCAVGGEPWRGLRWSVARFP